MPKLINENTGQEVRIGTFTTPNGDRINRDSLTRWSDEELNQIGIRREPDPPPPPPPPPVPFAVQLQQRADGDVLLSAIVDALAEITGRNRASTLTWLKNFER